MSSTLPVRIGGSPPASTDPLARAADYATAEKSDATRRAYGSDFNHFSTWCFSAGRTPLPGSPETVAAYLAHLADSGLKASTITRRCAAITYAHRLKGCPPPTLAEPVKAVLRGIRRRIGTAVERKAPATARAIRDMLRRIPLDNLGGKRDRALLLIGFSAALRRSELVALSVVDIETVPEGIVIHVRRGKTDQEGQGAEIAVPKGSRLRPVEALTAWLEARDTPGQGPGVLPADPEYEGEAPSSSSPLSPGGDDATSAPLFISIAK